MRQSTNMTLKFEGVEDYKDADMLSLPIEVLAWSWGLSVNEEAGVNHYGQKYEAGPTLQDLSLTKFIGLESAHLIKIATEGRMIQSVRLEIQNTNNMVLVLHNVRIISVSTGGSGGEERLTENISLSFAEMQYEFASRSEDQPKGSTSVRIAKK